MVGMKYDPDKHHRRSIRLKGYDYSQSGAYFVTICINEGLPTLGEIHDGQIYPSSAGEMVQTVWNEMPLYYPDVELDAFILMPNHLHGIIILNHKNIVQTHTPMTLGDVIHRFKSLTTTKYRRGVNEFGWTPFPKKLWQRNYYEQILRNEESLDKIRSYIFNNPLAWESEPCHLQTYHPQPDK